MDQDKPTTSRNRKNKENGVGLVKRLENLILASRKKKTSKKHVVGSEEDGVHLAGNCHHGAKQASVNSFHPASRRA